MTALPLPPQRLPLTVADYVALAEEVSGQDLDHFFDVWLFTPTKPTDW